jgi:DNA-binding MarR family transcriptional regulator/N-acetylglutamate synthase-like GNAT family acetyltransferase
MPLETDPSVAAVRGFNRFYTRQIGLLRKSYLNSPFSLTEARVLFEVAHRENPNAAELAKDLDLDPGYLSRLLQRFEERGLVSRQPSLLDGRQYHLSLTSRGRKVFAPLDRHSHEQALAMLKGLSQPESGRLIDAMHTIEHLLGREASASQAETEPYAIRLHRPGDIGWVIWRHGVLYRREYGWGEQFEALVAEIGARFLRQFDPGRERCWIAERLGNPVGSVFLVKETDEVAKLRLLLVEPEARGLGIGEHLVNNCIEFARATGYRTLRLWTQANLDAAQHIYQKAGFQIVKEEMHELLGTPSLGRTWGLSLCP